MINVDLPAARVGKVFVILNPASGRCTENAVYQALQSHFNLDNGACQVHELQPDTDLNGLVRSAVEQGAELVVAAGGDGTVAGVAAGLMDTGVPLGILPVGTANMLARELGIPLDLDEGCRLLADIPRITAVDAMLVESKPYFTHLGVGIDALMMRDTKTEHKKRFGRLAYIWSGLVELVGFQPRRFLLTVDDQHPKLFRASQVLVANVGMLGQPPFRWGPNIRPDDGELTVCVIRARTAWDYLHLSWRLARGVQKSDPNVRYYNTRTKVGIAMKSAHRPLPVQADGEIIGETPVEVSLAAEAVRVVVPAERD